MPKFTYQGRDIRGKKSGTITSPSRREALLKLQGQGIRVTQINEVPETLLTKEITIGNPVKQQDFVIYLRQFSTLLKAGVSVVDSTKILAAQTESKALSRTLIKIEEDLRGGIPLSSAAGKHTKIFSNMFVNMTKAGEASGSLDETLERLATHYEKQHRTRQKIKAALAYPTVVGIIAIFVVIFLLIFVVPTFVDMFKDFGADLPAITQFVLNASKFMQKFWYVVILLMILTVILFIYLRSNKTTRFYLDVVSLKLPVFGKMLQKAAIARMTRTLASLFSSSVPILQSLAIVENVVENEVIARVLKLSRDSLENGRSLTEPMKKHWAFPPLVTQMIAIGEETGSLDAMLNKIADFYEAEVETTTDQLKSLIEPLMIVFLAGIVGVIVISIMVPMFEIYGKIQ